MSNANNIINIAITEDEINEVVLLPMLPKVAACNINLCDSLLKRFRFNRGVFEDLSCYIVNPEYMAWTVKLRLPGDGEVIEDNGNDGFVPPTQLVFADVLRNYMERIVPLNFAVGDITIELRFVANQEVRLWCVDFVMEPVDRNDLPMPPALPHIQCKLPKRPKTPAPAVQAKKVCTVNVGGKTRPLPLPLVYPLVIPPTNPPVPNNYAKQLIKNPIQSVLVSKKKKRKKKKKCQQNT